MRRLCAADLVWLAELDCDPQVMRYIRPPSTREQAFEDAAARIAWDARHPQFGLWAAVDAASSVVHGWAGLKPFDLAESVDRSQIELGFRFRTDSWGRGFAREAGARLLEYGWDELGLERVLGVAMASNAGSKSVLERLGFRFVERVKLDSEWDHYEITGRLLRPDRKGGRADQQQQDS